MCRFFPPKCSCIECESDRLVLDRLKERLIELNNVSQENNPFGLHVRMEIVDLENILGI